MKKSYHENVYFKKRTDHSLRNYKMQKNLFSRPYKKKKKKEKKKKRKGKKKKDFFNNLNTSLVSDNKL